MSQIINTLADFVSYLNALYESDSTAPTFGDEDYTVWTSLANLAINLWENEEGMLWSQLFVNLADAADGDKTTTTANSYDLPSDFKFSASGYVWLGDGAAKTPYKVVKPNEVQLYENSAENWCYFDIPGLTLEFNPNLDITAGQTINYRYYKYATKLTAAASIFEMSDPMFAVYYSLSELKKEEGDTSAAVIASQKLEAMKTKNEMPAPFQVDNLLDKTSEGFGV